MVLITDDSSEQVGAGVVDYFFDFGEVVFGTGFFRCDANYPEHSFMVPMHFVFGSCTRGRTKFGFFLCLV